MQEIMKQSPITPDVLYGILQNNEQFQKMIPKTDQDAYGLKSLPTDGYTKLNITLIFNIVRYYSTCNLFIPIPKQGWDSDPKQEDVGIGDDTQRMRKMRNKIITAPSKTLSEGEFEEFSTRMLAIGARVDEYFKCKSCVTSFQKRIHDFLLDPIDKEMEEKTMEKIFCLEDLSLQQKSKSFLDSSFTAEIEISFRLVIIAEIKIISRPVILNSRN
ncbi:unnamed protein product [Mytilus coruscus]|uniref:Uncharacterized protein n=1 Tax=Mytilus coruscus TaxID=42192 RepID=A0A6J8DF46_MYTCO|nr:unnamed protein product [Mytilus coruscus]